MESSIEIRISPQVSIPIIDSIKFINMLFPANSIASSAHEFQQWVVIPEFNSKQ